MAVADPDRLAYITQTTLSVDDTAAIVACLRQRFPAIIGPHKEDICYATTNRQEAVKAIAGDCDMVLVIGAPNSSNSLRLVEVARKAGCPSAALVQRAADIDWPALELLGVDRESTVMLQLAEVPMNIALDRVLFMHEAGMRGTYCEEVFDPSISPRSTAIVSTVAAWSGGDERERCVECA